MVVPPSSAIITWNTNRNASTQVIYGRQSGGSYDLDTALPNYGYPSATVEDFTLTVSHSAPLSGLTPGTTYAYRVVSRREARDNPTISPEFAFTLPLRGEPSTVTPTSSTSGGGGGSTSGGGAFAPRQAGGDVSSGNQITAAEDDQTTESNQAAAALFAIPEELLSLASLACLGIALLILILIYALWLAVERALRYRQSLSREARSRRRNIFFLAALAAAVALAFLFSSPCVAIPLMLFFVLLGIWFSVSFFIKPSSGNYN